MQDKSENPAKSVAKTKTPDSLQNIILTYIAHNQPALSLNIIHDQRLEISDLKNFLAKNTTLINLLPRELKFEILKQVPLKDWKALRNVSKEWRQLVASEANSRIKLLSAGLNLILTFDTESMMKSLLNQVEAYSLRRGSRHAQVVQLKQLGENMHCLTTPLAKFLHYHDVINTIQEDIQREYRHGGMGFFPMFSGPQNSQLFQIIRATSSKCLKLTKESWFKD
ncbi:MAG: hypothetical protein BGO44_04965 [Legionella sp. 39-23]|nr:MAG: hypothetical protein BGO44_04965 [Legionella sp. 39-23]